MWIMTAFGALYPCARPVKYIPKGDKRTMQVRARRKEYLEHLNTVYLAGKGEIVSGEDATGHLTDYQWRLYCTPAQLTSALGQINNEIVEDQMQKFKPYTETKRGLGDKALARQLHTTYTSMWADMLKLSDGTSSYDTWSYYAGQDKIPVDPWNCVPRELGGVYGTHYFAKGAAKCSDCKKQRPRKFKGQNLSWDAKKDKLPDTLPPAKRPKPATKWSSYDSQKWADNGSYCKPGKNGWCTASWHTHTADKKCNDDGSGYCTVHTTSGDVKPKNHDPDYPPIPWEHDPGEPKEYNDAAYWYSQRPKYNVKFAKGDQPSKFCRYKDAANPGYCTTIWHDHEGQPSYKPVTMVTGSSPEIGPTGTNIKSVPLYEHSDGSYDATCGECGEPLDYDGDFCGWCGVLVDWDNATTLEADEAEVHGEVRKGIPEVLNGLTGGEPWADVPEEQEGRTR